MRHLKGIFLLCLIIGCNKPNRTTNVFLTKEPLIQVDSVKNNGSKGGAAQESVVQELPVQETGEKNYQALIDLFNNRKTSSPLKVKDYPAYYGGLILTSKVNWLFL